MGTSNPGDKKEGGAKMKGSIAVAVTFPPVTRRSARSRESDARATTADATAETGGGGGMRPPGHAVSGGAREPLLGGVEPLTEVVKQASGGKSLASDAGEVAPPPASRTVSEPGDDGSGGSDAASVGSERHARAKTPTLPVALSPVLRATLSSPRPHEFLVPLAPGSPSYGTVVKRPSASFTSPAKGKGNGKAKGKGAAASADAATDAPSSVPAACDPPLVASFEESSAVDSSTVAEDA